MKKKLLSVFILLLLLSFPSMELNSSSYIPPAAAPIGPPPPEDSPSPETSEEPTNEVPVFSDGIYTLSMISSVGTLTYYNQHDVRWAGEFFGGNDPISGYGCGPTALAMVVSSFTEHTMPPNDMAHWAADNHYWVAGHGSKHGLIPEGAAAFGLHAESFGDLTEEGVKNSLATGHILIALMGPGHFTANGHFIVITDYWSDSQVSIADPNSLENTQKPWDIQLILNELKKSSTSGGPVWEISPK